MEIKIYYDYNLGLVALLDTGEFVSISTKSLNDYEQRWLNSMYGD